MKTPREMLLAAHRSAGPKLDRIRRSVLSELNIQDAPPLRFLSGFAPLRLCCLDKLWLELVWPCRRTWTGLASVWLVILIVNFSQRDHGGAGTGKPFRSAPAVLSLQAQQRWMNQLLADRSPAPEADRPRYVIPKPRTENTPAAAV